MKLSILMATIMLITLPAIADELTFVIPGGTKGVFMGQAVSHTEDMTRVGYKTSIGAPGDTCSASELVNNSNHPTLFIWSSDAEANAQMGNGCAAPEFAADDVIAMSFSPVFVCTLDPTVDPLSGEYNLGIWLGVEAVHTSVVKKLNSVAGSNLNPVPYDGSSSVLTALTNGEIEVALLPPSRAATVRESGGACNYMFANAEQDTVAKSLVEIYSDTGLNLTSMDIIVSKNWNDKVNALTQEIYSDPSSSVSQNPSKFNNNIPADVMNLWTSAIGAFVIK